MPLAESKTAIYIRYNANLIKSVRWHDKTYELNRLLYEYWTFAAHTRLWANIPVCWLIALRTYSLYLFSQLRRSSSEKLIIISQLISFNWRLCCRWLCKLIIFFKVLDCLSIKYIQTNEKNRYGMYDCIKMNLHQNPKTLFVLTSLT